MRRRVRQTQPHRPALEPSPVWSGFLKWDGFSHLNSERPTGAGWHAEPMSGHERTSATQAFIDGVAPGAFYVLSREGPGFALSGEALEDARRLSDLNFARVRQMRRDRALGGNEAGSPSGEQGVQVAEHDGGSAAGDEDATELRVLPAVHPELP